jgi:hypothetical protein
MTHTYLEGRWPGNKNIIGILVRIVRMKEGPKARGTDVSCRKVKYEGNDVECPHEEEHKVLILT